MNGIIELRRMRAEQSAVRDVDRLLELAKPLILSGAISRAGSEAWDIYEQSLVAALEVADDELALTCLTRLSDKFPQSGRVHALRGMLLEATQDPQEALTFYKEVLEVEPTNVIIRKRQITFEKSLGRLVEAVAHLVQYLDVYYTDGDAWAELGDLYTSLHHFDRAIFSWSEALILKPHDHDTHASYADALYAQWLSNSDPLVLHTALKSYLRSLELSDDNLRSVCGIKMCCDHILRSKIYAPDSHKPRTASTQTNNKSVDLVTHAKVKELSLMSLKWLLKAERHQDSHREDQRISSLLRRLTGSQSVTVR
ncbi:TPR repeat protein Oca3 [Taphrina deformans PYCC 5710]|uniref:ER membrane protein complex subunit 2 n=1 Tax=Taphrina deformans (strain PYCC 5710 / ATCC 11124 / CBS 356.35 / IMI 108563 / JCM 9778 / NBRC 8474) TaxID=1097556 RepID=R4XAM6_TAPDE|nr:TPR repeat protein Oca3 [Taphrina deformans PYCC 5710]|eukprot:CCG82848.1 TPR repeat protein Oca3 [Taphrina deformans PYCC 5710]